MTIPAILERGFQTRKEHGDSAKLSFLNSQSAMRFCTLPWVLEARALDLRILHRRWLRRMGLRKAS